LGLCQMIRSRT